MSRYDKYMRIKRRRERKFGEGDPRVINDRLRRIESKFGTQDTLKRSMVENLERQEGMLPEQEEMLRENYAQQQEAWEAARQVQEMSMGRYQDLQAREAEQYGLSQDLYGMMGGFYNQSQDVFNQAQQGYGQAQDYYNLGQNLYQQGQDMYGQGQDVFNLGQEVYGQGQNVFNLGQNLYQQGQDVYGQSQDIASDLMGAAQDQYGYMQGQQAEMGNIQNALLGAAGYGPGGEMNARGQDLQGMREGLLGLSGAYRGMGPGGEMMGMDERMAALPAEDQARVQSLMGAYGGLEQAQNAAPGEYLGSKAIEHSISEANRLAKESSARAGRHVGSTGRAQQEADLMTQAAIARDTGQQNAINTYAGLVGQGENVARAKEAGLASGFGDISQSTTAGLENLLTGAGLSQAGVGIGQQGLGGLVSGGSQGANIINQGYGAAGQGYGSLNQGYGALNQGYGAVGEGYDAAMQGYGAAGAGYGALGSGLGATQQAYQDILSGLGGVGSSLGGMQGGLSNMAQIGNQNIQNPFIADKSYTPYADFTQPYGQYQQQVQGPWSQLAGQRFTGNQAQYGREQAYQMFQEDFDNQMEMARYQNQFAHDMLWEQAKAQNWLNSNPMLMGYPPSSGGGGGMGAQGWGSIIGGAGGLIGGMSQAGWLSDRKLKKDITETDVGLDEVNKLKPVEFKWKDTDRVALGLIAQDVEEVIPTAVLKDDHGTRYIDYSQIITALVNSVNKLTKELNVLKAIGVTYAF